MGNEIFPVRGIPLPSSICRPFMLVGTNLKFAKAYNVRIVLETIRLYGPLSRADVARRTELTAQTVSNITRKLLKKDLLEVAHRRQDGRGAPSVLLALRPDCAFSIGVDLDKDHLTAVLVDFVGTVRHRIHMELNFPSPDEAMDLIVDAANQLMEAHGLRIDQIWGVGVGLPGPLDISSGSVVTNVVNPKAFPGWVDVPVADILTRRLAMPIYLENNATAAAVGERRYGAGRHISTFFYVFFGAGLGGGMIIDGHPYEGRTGNAGELGYTPISGELDGEADFKRPHLGVYFNLPRLYKLLANCGHEVHHPMDLEPLLEEGNSCLIEWLDTGAEKLAPVVLGIEYLLDPEAIFFGGRLPTPLILALMARLEAILPNIRVDGKHFMPKLLTATAGADAAALGVATLPLYAAFAPAPKVLMKRDGDEEEGVFAPATPRVAAR